MDVQTLEQAQFAPVTLDDWTKLANKVLKGADFEQTLVSTTADGLKIQPLAMRRPASSANGRKNPEKAWTISQRVDDPEPVRAITQIQSDLANGTMGLNLVLANSISSFGTGLSEISDPMLKAAVTSDATLRLECASPKQASDIAVRMAKVAGSDQVHYGIDLFSHALLNSSEIELADMQIMQTEVANLSTSQTTRTIFNAEGRLAHNCGASEAQELAIIAASLVETARFMEFSGLSPEAVLARTSLCVAVNQNQYLNIAKLRALRLMIVKIQSTLGLAKQPLHIYAETSWRMLTSLDPETNVLRNTIAAFSAGIAGADEITILPHTLSLGLPDTLARRLARNTQLILADECHLAHVTDAAAGSGSLENLTDTLAETAWGLFQSIEQKGGLSTAIAKGLIRDWINAARQNAQSSPIVGTTIYPQKTERVMNILMPLGPIIVGNGLQPERLDQSIAARHGDKTQ